MIIIIYGLVFPVLADVPCSSDRFSVNNDDDNIFSVGKMRERELLPEYQALLLFNAYMMCKPGGFIVYSTCTLSPSQVSLLSIFFSQVSVFCWEEKKAQASESEISVLSQINIDRLHLRQKELHTGFLQL